MASTELAATASPTTRTAWERNLRAPVRRFLHTQVSGAIVLVAAALIALVWASIGGSYESVWTTQLSVTLGDHAISTDLRGWVNEGLMTLFFLQVGLEATRELDLGELRERRRLAIPALAAIGGMALAAAAFLAINAGGDGAGGWGVAASTDTALALGTLALLTRGRAVRLRVFLLTLVVVDDLLALAVIGIAYSDSVSAVALAVAVGLFGVLVALRYAPGGWRGPAAALTGVALWGALFQSGVDAVVAGLAIGLVTSAYRRSARTCSARSTWHARSASSPRPSWPTRRGRA
jgi:Na+/H+ antiporter NhaA